MKHFLRDYLAYTFGNKKNQKFIIPEISVELFSGMFSFRESIYYLYLKNDLNLFLKHLDLSLLKLEEVCTLISYKEIISQDIFNKLNELYPEECKLFIDAKESGDLTTSELQELLDYKTHNLSVICIFSRDRSYKGRLLIRLKDGTFLKKDNGKLWSLPVLGKSSRGLPFYITNGQTPCGVYHLKSVMPEANNQKEFGINRRVKIQFLKDDFRDYLPETLKSNPQFKEALFAQKAGRNLLRIHGTGERNNNIFSKHFPLVPSSGCLTLRELRLGKWMIFNDQRVFLDKIMQSQGLDVSFENETSRESVLYVVNFNGKFQELKFK